MQGHRTSLEALGSHMQEGSYHGTEASDNESTTSGDPILRQQSWPEHNHPQEQLHFDNSPVEEGLPSDQFSIDPAAISQLVNGLNALTHKQGEYGGSLQMTPRPVQVMEMPDEFASPKKVKLKRRKETNFS
ncbi:hypothetical protein IMSHALPRED_003230 [Imshaugia aleurites]|uniref:Uncharacterized protein n=1 Tax=Imshaugia aleurites TaxID=172621 RepID=A0A8H3F3L5_9LECA|nr:hypothetical protein IMSHALPRED_003230 [Imshaugia aleurites]